MTDSLVPLGLTASRFALAASRCALAASRCALAAGRCALAASRCALAARRCALGVARGTNDNRREFRPHGTCSNQAPRLDHTSRR